MKLLASFLLLALPLGAQQRGPVRLRANIVEKVQHVIDGAKKDADLWEGDVCNWTPTGFSFPKGDVRNALRREGVEALSDITGANVIIQGKNTGKVAVLKRVVNAVAKGCAAVGVADSNQTLAAVCLGVSFASDPNNESFTARTPPVEENVARIAGEGNLDLLPGACLPVTVISNPQRKTKKPNLRTVEVYLQAPPVSLTQTASWGGVVRTSVTKEPSIPEDAVSVLPGLPPRPVDPLADLAYRAGLPEAPEPGDDLWTALVLQ